VPKVRQNKNNTSNPLVLFLFLLNTTGIYLKNKWKKNMVQIGFTPHQELSSNVYFLKQFEKLLFHEYERVYLRTYQKAFQSVTDKFFNHLHTLYPIRNKIAHNHVLSDEEMDIVKNSSTYLKLHIELAQV
jgi:NADH:ubiquinone oxidoreductase subunit 5 (subunit L)/multisubunit Na+/H+ antiporter MnhA subunit